MTVITMDDAEMIFTLVFAFVLLVAAVLAVIDRIKGRDNLHKQGGK